MATQKPAHVCVAAFPTTAKALQQPRYPSLGKWINKTWLVLLHQWNIVHLWKGLSYQTMKAWRKLSHILLSERNHFEKVAYCVTTHEFLEMAKL
jgi:hypothetical protein